MKRSNDYIQSHDAYKKPRVAQTYNNFHGHGNLGSSGAADLYGNAGAYGVNPMMMGAYSQPVGGPYGGDQSMVNPYGSITQQYQNPAAFAPGYGATPFQVSFPSATGTGGVPAGRTVYIGGIPSDATMEDVLNLVKTGMVEHAKLLPEKNCAFISFMDGNSASLFHHEATTRKFSINGQEIKVGWGKASPVPSHILQAVQQNATRNVFIGNVDSAVTEQTLRDDMSQYGTIDTIKILRDKNIAFVHFSSIQSAIKAVTNLPHEPNYTSRRVFYGKDRCAKNMAGSTTGSGSMQGSFAFNPAFGGQYGAAMPVSFSPVFDRFSPAGGSMNPGKTYSNGVSQSALTAQGSRTVYLGNISPDTTCEDICNVIRGGILNNIRYLPSKHIAFVSFVDPQAAMNFFNQATYNGVMVKNRRLKVGWGQNAHSLPPQVVQALQDGATRNVYLGNIEEGWTEDKLRQDFAEFGDIELVNILKDKNCGFVNFTNILSAVKAIEGIRKKPEYAKVKVNHGKDRCGNPPKPVKNSNDRAGGSGSGGSHHHNGNSNNNSSSNQNGDHDHGSGSAGGDGGNDDKVFDEDDDMFGSGI
ncbi:hypothetical protein DFQ26_008497 [Actinomortierella ambigua]|nr:hypothetical protein DFQ26_008497 [Actinomortierella ambigua]